MMQAANDNYDLDAPMRLADAVKIAFPHGGMKVSGLRKEAAKGRLVIELIAHKQFTTLRAINEMRNLCRVQQNQPVSGSGQGAATVRRSGSFSTADGNMQLDAAMMIAQGLTERSCAISPRSTRKRRPQSIAMPAT